MTHARDTTSRNGRNEASTSPIDVVIDNVIAHSRLSSFREAILLHVDTSTTIVSSIRESECSVNALHDSFNKFIRFDTIGR